MRSAAGSVTIWESAWTPVGANTISAQVLDPRVKAPMSALPTGSHVRMIVRVGMAKNSNPRFCKGGGLKRYYR